MSPPPLGYLVRACAVTSTDKCSSEKSNALKARPAPQVLSRAVRRLNCLAFLTSFFKSGNSKLTEPAASSQINVAFSEGVKLSISIGL